MAQQSDSASEKSLMRLHYDLQLDNSSLQVEFKLEHIDAIF